MTHTLMPIAIDSMDDTYLYFLPTRGMFRTQRTAATPDRLSLSTLTSTGWMLLLETAVTNAPPQEQSHDLVQRWCAIEELTRESLAATEDHDESVTP